MTKTSKWLFLICQCMLGLVLNAQQIDVAKKTIVAGKLLNIKNEILFEDMSEWKDLKLAADDIRFMPDSFGAFHLTLTLDKPKYYRLGYNQVYLKPGDSLYVVIDMNSRATSYAGDIVVENYFLLHVPTPKAGSFLEGGRGIRPTTEQTVAYIEQRAEERLKLIDSVNFHDKHFEKLEKARVKADIMNSYGSLFSYFIFEHNLQGDAKEKVRSFYYDTLSVMISALATDFIDTAFMALPVYRDISYALPLKTDSSMTAKRIADWRVANAINWKLLQNPNRDSLKSITLQIASVQSTDYKRKLSENVRVLERFNEGDVALDFLCETVDGNSIALSAYKGKIIYLDFWATWCLPCIELFPELVKLRKSLQDNPDIVFLSISIDDDLEKWKRKSAILDPDAQHLQVNRLKLGAYNIYGIPRAIIIDKQFRVVKMNAPDPASPKLKSMLEDLAK